MRLEALCRSVAVGAGLAAILLPAEALTQTVPATQPVDIRAVSTPTRTVPVSGKVTVSGTVTSKISNTTANPVPVAVVNGTAYQAVNARGDVGVVAGNIGGEGIVYRNTGTRAVIFSSLSFYGGTTSCTPSRPVLGMFEVIKEYAGYYSLLARAAAAIEETHPDGGCFWTLTLPGTMTVGPGEALRAEFMLSQASAGNIGLVASASGHTLP